MANWSSRDKKQASREYVIGDYLQEHAAIFMPGWDEEAGQAGQDIRTGIDTGSLDLSKRLIIVERDEAIAPLIEQDIRSLGFADVRMHVGELADLDLTGERVDFAFIDLFGALDEKLCRWMRDQLAPVLTMGGTVGLTMAFARRNNHFMAEAERIYRDDFAPFTSKMRAHYQITGHQRLVPVMLMRAAFNDHSFAYHPLMKYQDTTFSMLTYLFTDFRKVAGTNGSPPLNAVINLLKPKEGDVTMTDDRSSAAHKAWDTRRAKAEAEKRSAAANKAWATRRAQAAQPAAANDDPRSAAAHKAWETRRANGWVHPSKRAA